MHDSASQLRLRFRVSAVLAVALLAAIVGASYAISWHAAQSRMSSVVRERGAALFHLIEVTRKWNALHGGVYVPVTPETQPNPYLEHPKRDAVTQDGRSLTMVNPAYMTRQISEIAGKADGFHFHITSARPIRPQNKPDPWESEALAQFENGLPERIELIEGAFPVHRYMAPLRVEPPCMKCHAKQGYQIGQIRGGISVDMPAAELLAARNSERTHSAWGHALTFVLMSSLAVGFLWRSYSHTWALKAINREQDDLIQERTAQLTKTNEALAEKVEEQEVAATVFEHASQAIAVLDSTLQITRSNPAFCKLTGYSDVSDGAMSLEKLSSSATTAEFLTQISESLVRSGSWSGEMVCQRQQDSRFLAWLSIVTVAGDAPRYVATLTDITDSKALEADLRHRVNHDALTGLPNRALFGDRLAMAIAQSARQQRSMAVFMMDLDHFKEVNDSLGHSAGDRLLVEAAARLQRCVRESDTLARLGGDEFGVVLTEFGSLAELQAVADRLVRAVERPFELGSGVGHVSISIGIARYPQDGTTHESLVERADAALYTVKSHGRQGFQFAS